MRALRGALVALLMSSSALAAKAPPPCPAGPAGDLCRRVAAIENANRNAAIGEANRNAAVNGLRGRVEALERARVESDGRIEALEDYAAGLEGEVAELNGRLARLERMAAEMEHGGGGCGAGQVPVCCGEDETFCPQAGCADLENDPANCGECGRHCGGGACVGGECQAPPPRVDARLDCACNDGARVSGCFPTTCSAAERVALCERICFDHHGVNAEVPPGCFESPECRPEEPPPPPPADEPGFLLCQCADGNRRELCLPAACEAVDQFAACGEACARNGGLGEALPPFCQPGGDRCAGRPAGEGPGLLICTCADGVRHEACLPAECGAVDDIAACDQLCGRNGGQHEALPPFCAPAGDRCGAPAPPAVPDKLLTCQCNDGSRPQHCVVSTCAEPERVAMCERACAERGGPSREQPASCFEAGPECRVP